MNNFSDRKKFSLVEQDPTNNRLTSVQSYIRDIHKRDEINKTVYKEIYPKIARAYRTAKIHKKFEKLPPFLPIIDTIGSTHYSVGLFISHMSNPLTVNAYQLKDYFDAAERIKIYTMKVMS